MQRALDSILNYRKFDFHHIFNHEFIGEMGIYTSNQSCCRIAHPNINDIRANVLLANRCEGMAQTICCFICKQFFHNIVDFNGVYTIELRIVQEIYAQYKIRSEVQRLHFLSCDGGYE